MYIIFDDIVSIHKGTTLRIPFKIQHMTSDQGEYLLIINYYGVEDIFGTNKTKIKLNTR